jgi:DNA-binding NarL/FixJ family response regulator
LKSLLEQCQQQLATATERLDQQSAIRAALLQVTESQQIPPVKITRIEVKSADRRMRFTSQEIVITNLMSKGLVDKEIAHFLNCSKHTVRAHIRNIIKKLGVSGKHEALAALRTLDQKDLL